MSRRSRKTAVGKPVARRPSKRPAAKAPGIPIADPVELVRGLLAQAFDPYDLTLEQRRQCVEILCLERHVTRRQVARLLKVHYNTVDADVAAIQRRAGNLLRKRYLAGDATAAEAAVFLRRNEQVWNAAINSGDLAIARGAAADRARVLGELGLVETVRAGAAPAGSPVNVAVVIQCDEALRSRFDIPALDPTSSSAVSISVESGSASL